jgi:signal transduction histidine kinase
MAEPNIDFGSPTIFFDSHPEEQESYLYSYWSSFKATLKIAVTGQVPKFLNPGTLRIIWYTHDGNEGLKDYELHEYALVRDNFDVLLRLDEVRRVVIMGYSGQNPYILGDGGRNPWQDRFQREFKKMGREGREAKLAQEKMEGTVHREDRDRKEREKKERLDNSKEARTGKLVDIEGVIEEHDRAEEERMRIAREAHWKESDGLLTGEMV